MDQEIKKSVLMLVELQFGIRDVKETDLLVEELGAESADVANLVAAVEEKFGVMLKESEIARIYTSQDLSLLVEQKLNDS
jgi:acyl carrier protein